MFFKFFIFTVQCQCRKKCAAMPLHPTVLFFCILYKNSIHTKKGYLWRECTECIFQNILYKKKEKEVIFLGILMYCVHFCFSFFYFFIFLHFLSFFFTFLVCFLGRVQQKINSFKKQHTYSDTK